jgi:ribonuclease P protein component
MLHKANRLRASADFKRVRNRGRSWAAPLVVLYAYRRRGDGVRAGFAVSKRVGKATVRNHVKRLMREGLRATLSQVKSGYDLVLIARPAAANATFWDIKQSIDSLLRRSGLLRELNYHA